MPAIRSDPSPKSEAFQANAARMAGSLAEVQALQAKVVAESESRRVRVAERGLLLPRERATIDGGSYFLELSPLAGLGMHDDDGKKSVQGGGSIVGIGVVAGKRVLVDPRDTRHVVGLCLAIAREDENPRPAAQHLWRGAPLNFH